MKRDWDLIRKYLLAIENEADLKSTILASVLEDPRWKDGQSEQEYIEELAEFRARENVICGHLELLLDGGYIVGMSMTRTGGGGFGFSLSSPRLTNEGHDLLDSIRSPKVWKFIKDTAKTKGVELTLDAVKALYPLAMKMIFS